MGEKVCERERHSGRGRNKPAKILRLAKAPWFHSQDATRGVRCHS